MLVNVYNQQETLTISVDQVQKIVEQVLQDEDRSCDEVNIYFVNVETISQLHHQFFNDDSPTDCLSFPLDDVKDFNYQILGEVFVCPATAVAYSAKLNKDCYIETTLYIVHGLLHLLGYDDLTVEERKLMRKAEIRHMRKLKNLQLLLTRLETPIISTLQKITKKT